MKVNAVDHVHLNVRDLGSAVPLFTALTGCPYPDPIVIDELKARMVWNWAGLELMEPMSGDSPIARAIDRNGEGVTAVCFGVTDLESSIREAERTGLRVVSRIGAEGVEAQVQFHPRDSFGVMIELVQRLEGYPEDRPVDAFHHVIDHIHVYVKDLSRAAALFSGLTGSEFRSPVSVPEIEALTAIDPLGLDLVQPTAPESPIARHIARRGEGVAAVSFRVSDIEAGIARAEATGLRLISRIGYPGAMKQAQFHPRDSFGVMVELSERTP